MTPIILNLKPSTREKLSSQPDEPVKKFELLKVFGTALKKSSHHAEMRIDATTTLLPLPFSFLRQFELALKVGVTQ